MDSVSNSKQRTGREKAFKAEKSASATASSKKTSTFLNNNKNTANSNQRVAKFTFQLKAKFDGCEISAKLLETPCLKAAYSIKDINCQSYITNHNSKTQCVLNSHCLSFQCDDDPQVVFYLPSISLVSNHVIHQVHTDITFDVKIAPLNRELNAEVIAQLVFVTKVFLKEINIILQAVYNLDQSNQEHSKAKAAKPSLPPPPPPPPPLSPVSSPKTQAHVNK